MTQEIIVTFDCIKSPKNTIWDEIKVGEFFIYRSDLYGVTSFLYRKTATHLAPEGITSTPNALPVLDDVTGTFREVHINGKIGIIKKVKKVEFFVTVEE